MKTVLYIFNTLMMILFASINSVQATGLSATNELKLERYSVLGAWFLFGVCMLITYLIWKKRSRAALNRTNEKCRVRNYTVINQGKKLVITRKLPNQNSPKKVA